MHDSCRILISGDVCGTSPSSQHILRLTTTALLRQCHPDTTPDATGVPHTPHPPLRTVLCREAKRPRTPGQWVSQTLPRTPIPSRGLAVRDKQRTHSPIPGFGLLASALPPQTTPWVRYNNLLQWITGTLPMSIRLDLVDLVCKSLPHVRVRSEQTMECFQNPRRPHRWHVTLARFSNYDRTHRTHVTSALVMKKIRPYLASQKSHDQTWTHATKRTRNRLRTRKRVPNPSRNNNLAKSRNKKHCNNRKPKHRKHAIARKLNFMAFKNKFKTSHHCLVCDQLAQLMMPLCHPRTNLTTSPLPRSQATTSELGVN